MSLSQLLIDQIEFANVVVLNKIDLVSKKQINQIKTLVSKLNPDAEVLLSKFGDVPIGKIINTKKFDFEEAQASAGWLKELMKPAHNPETEEYGIKSWIYRRHRPFHPKRFYDFMLKLQNNPNNLFKQCIRAKGTIWIASRHLHSFQFHKAGTLVSLNPLDLWYAEIPRENWGGNEAEI